MTKMNEDSINYSALDRDIKSRLSDFVKNPELVKDLLPQPYRLEFYSILRIYS